MAYGSARRWGSVTSLDKLGFDRYGLAVLGWLLLHGSRSSSFGVMPESSYTRQWSAHHFVTPWEYLDVDTARQRTRRP